MRRVLTTSAPLLLCFAACGGQTSSDAGDAGGESPMAGAPGSGGTFGSGGTWASGGALGSGSQSGTGAVASGGSGTGGGGSGPVACLPGTYDSNLADDALTCEPWSSCPPGSRFVAFGSFDRDTVCEECPAGTFSADDNSNSCTPFSKCQLGLEEDDAPTVTSDRTCTPADFFAPYPEGGTPGSLVVTANGIYLSALESYGGTSFVFYHSPAGFSSDTFPISEQTQGVPDLTHLSISLYAAGTTYDTDADPDVMTEPAFLKKFGPEGALLWTLDFDDDPSEHFSHVQAAARGDEIYVVGRVQMMDCQVNPEGTFCGDDVPEQHVELRVVAPDGQPVFATALEGTSGVTAVYDLAVATDGHLFVMVDRTVGVVPAACEGMSPDDPDYYAYCIVPTFDQKRTIFEFDAAGELVSEHQHNSSLPHLSASEWGSVYAIVGAEQGPALYRMGSSGVSTIQSLELETGDVISSFTAGENGVLAVGYAVDGPLLLELDTAGELQDRDVLEDYATGSGFVDLGQNYDFTVFAAGPMFIFRWP